MELLTDRELFPGYCLNALFGDDVHRTYHYLVVGRRTLVTVIEIDLVRLYFVSEPHDKEDGAISWSIGVEQFPIRIGIHPSGVENKQWKRLY